MKKDWLIQTALGETRPDLVLQNGKVINVFTGEIVSADIAITRGVISGVGKYSGKSNVDLDGKYVAPGFINAHCHVESSMVTPPAYCIEELKWGVTTVITDPHEITNVAGGEGVQFMLDSSEDLPINYYVQLPSCVPATPFEHAGAAFTADKMAPFLSHPRVLGLGEMMNYPGVSGRDPEVMAKLELFDGRVVDGHAPGITGNALQAYAAAGIHTDHESVTYGEALEKLRAGMAVLVREGSASKNLRDILSGVIANGIDTMNMAFCTDDKHLSDIRREGTILHNIKLAIELGMRPVAAIQMATINAARIYGLRDVGAVAPGYRADLVILNDLKALSVDEVYKDGKAYTEHATPRKGVTAGAGILHTVNLAPLEKTSFSLPDREKYPVIQIIPGQISTKKSSVSAQNVEEQIASGALRKIAVVERHHATGMIGVGLISGYGLTHGAVATTVAHDSHNLIVVGDNDADMAAAARELARVQGGYTIVADEDVKGTLALPVCGLMSSDSAQTLIRDLDKMIETARQAGVREGIDPFITLSFMALPVIPEIRITDMGVFDVTKFEFVK
ncbi:adenine deaminase [Marasmitruncus massiliensis]|uniref:adenine deaminase n=1 Tax=Marasmitruncus massiliensis TaxID=1944642 RepID=UPI000C7E656D|nr:adenine deaminase [Marasmitruncus massiliensis]